MQFHQLRHGARFQFRGTVYRKISPLMGASETDEAQQLIPRSAEVSLVDEQGQALPAELPQSFASERVEAELEYFLTRCTQAAGRLEPALTESQRTELQRAIRAAGHDLLTRLSLDSQTA